MLFYQAHFRFIIFGKQMNHTAKLRAILGGQIFYLLANPCKNSTFQGMPLHFLRLL
jgi:hypothetical protein